MKLLMVLSIVNLLAAIFLPACNSAGRAISDTTVQGVDIAATTAVPTPTTEIGALKVYHNPQAGYRAEYPAGWSVNEQVGADGSIATTFSPADGSAGIMVLVQSGEVAGAGNSDIPNTRCEQVTVGGLTGTRCFDTINFATSTTVAANGQTFTIAVLGKRIDENVYDQFLLGFQIIK